MKTVKLLHMTVLVLCLISFQTVHASAKPLIQVKVAFMEALAPKDTTSSERFQKEYEFAVQTGKNLTKDTLKKCGYELVEDKVFYDASDNLQALEQARKSEASGAWLIIGPRRSNHYLLAVKGAPETPSISIMASAKEVFELNPMHLTIAQSNQKMALIAAQEIQRKFKNRKSIGYISIVSQDCVSCLDFAESFDLAAKKLKLIKADDHRFTGDQPDITSLEKVFAEKKPQVVLLPNYSKESAYLMGIISRWNPNIFFVGGDGWGDAKYGFVHNSPQLSKTSGMTVKGFPPADKGLQYFQLGKEILRDPTLAVAFPTSGSAQALLKSLEDVSRFLCQHRPANKQEFAKSFKQSGKQSFKSPWGVSIYKLAEGEIVFDKTVK